MIHDIDLAHAFSMLVQEEIQKMIAAGSCYGWTVLDLGRSPGGFHDLPNAAFIISARFPKLTQENLLAALAEIAARSKGEEVPETGHLALTQSPVPHSFETAGHWSGQEHFFRVEISINHGLVSTQYPWEQVYIGRAHVVLRVWHSKSQHSVGWPVGLRPATTNDPSLLKYVIDDLRLNDVCTRIVWHIDDPKCQEGLVEKLHRAIGIYLLTYMLLPDH